MLALARESDADWVAMHSVSIPADRATILATDRDVWEQLEAWIEQRLVAWESARLNLDRIILDPGIGFGKTGLQSVELLRHAQRLARYGLRSLVGHSRKSFMKSFGERPAKERDIETVGASLKLCDARVDILRVHDVPSHARAHLAWSHLQAY